MAPLEIDNPFWQFSLRVYGAPGVGTECLDLQDRLGLDVNVVLFAAWLGASRGVVLDGTDVDRIEQAMEGWAAGVVRPLRAIRQRLKSLPEIAEEQVQALRKQVAGVELFAEQVEQALLYRFAQSVLPEAEPAESAARANILTILGTRGADTAAFPLSNLLAACSARND